MKIARRDFNLLIDQVIREVSGSFYDPKTGGYKNKSVDLGLNSWGGDTSKAKYKVGDVVKMSPISDPEPYEESRIAVITDVDTYKGEVSYAVKKGFRIVNNRKIADGSRVLEKDIVGKMPKSAVKYTKL